MGEEQERPEQQQERPGHEGAMEPEPRSEMADYIGSGKLAGRRALITGGDSGIGRAAAIAFAKEGADVAIAYLSEDEDAAETVRLIEATGARGRSFRSDLSGERACTGLVGEAAEWLGGLDLLVLHHADQVPVEDYGELPSEQWEHILRTNLTSFFWLSREAVARHLEEGSSIIMTGSVNGFRGNSSLIDYAVTKGGIHSLVHSLAQHLQDRGIRVNGVAPGPVWTPLIPATLDEEKVAEFGQQAPVGRVAQPDEIAPSYVFLASEELSSYYTGQILSPTGGEIHPG